MPPKRRTRAQGFSPGGAQALDISGPSRRRKTKQPTDTSTEPATTTSTNPLPKRRTRAQAQAQAESSNDDQHTEVTSLASTISAPKRRTRAQAQNTDAMSSDDDIEEPLAKRVRVQGFTSPLPPSPPQRTASPTPSQEDAEENMAIVQMTTIPPLSSNRTPPATGKYSNIYCYPFLGQPRTGVCVSLNQYQVVLDRVLVNFAKYLIDFVHQLPRIGIPS
jgi:hypothetical protein